MKKILYVFALLLACASVHAAGYDEARRDAVLKEITGARMPSETVSLLKFGAMGDGRKDCLPAFRKAMAQSKKKGGLHIVVPMPTICTTCR